MKGKLLILIILLKFSISYAQEPNIPKGAVQIDQTTIIKDTSGNIIPFEQFMTMINSGDWAAEPKFNKRGELEFLQLRAASEEDKKMMSSMRSGPNETERIGENLPAFNLTDIKGREFNSDSLIGKIIVINLWFTSCKPCVMEMPELNMLYSKYKNNSDIVFMSITYNSPKEIKGFLKKHDFDYPIIGSANETCSSFNIQGYPTNIIVDQTGKFSFFATGGFPGIGNVLEGEIQNLLSK